MMCIHCSLTSAISQNLDIKEERLEKKEWHEEIKLYRRMASVTLLHQQKNSPYFWAPSRISINHKATWLTPRCNEHRYIKLSHKMK